MANQQDIFQIMADFGKPADFYRNHFWRPEHEMQNPIVIPFTKAKKFVENEIKELITADCGFKGGEMQYSAGESAILSWWSAYVDQDEFEKVQNSHESSQEINDFFDPSKPSRYGENLFTYDLNQLIEAYETSINAKSEMRLFGSLVYTREVMDAIVIAPLGHKKFDGHELVNPKQEDSILTINEKGKYEWKCFSAINWDKKSPGYEKKRNWAHLAFGFLLEPENKIMKIPAVTEDGNWQLVIETETY